MSMPYSVEEIDEGLISEGLDELNGMERYFHDLNAEMRREYTGKTYNLDHCGDGAEYCRECCQPECGKRIK
jgi:hypothetical protein